MLALFGSLSALELIVIGLAAVLIFGRNLPRVAAETWAQISKLRRAMREMWRETGMEQELRRVQRDLDSAKRSLPRNIDPSVVARELTREIEATARPVRPSPPASDPPSAPNS